MTYGPIDFLALEIKGNKFTGEGLAALDELVQNGLIRIIDLVFVVKDENGEVGAVELQQLDQDTIRLFNPLKPGVSEMIKVEDIKMIGELLENNSTCAAMLYENLWAIKFKEAVLKAGARVIMQERIPHEVVLEAVEDLAAA